MHRIIFCGICLLALLGVFGSNDLGSINQAGLVSASDSGQRGALVARPGQPLTLAARSNNDVVWTVEHAPAGAEDLVGTTVATGGRVELSPETVAQRFPVPGSYVLRASTAEEVVVRVDPR
ncbi:MAG TPA: hypothetical protein VFS21_30780 [Roseiflexaceae bacterium]|nr:hypothetical protein [Roseiflexaceae bacterium]